MLGLGCLTLGLLLLQGATISSAKSCTLSSSTASQLKLDPKNVQNLLLMAGYAHYACSDQGSPVYNGTVADVFDVTCTADDIVTDLSKARSAGISAAAAEVVVRKTVGNVAPGGSQFSVDAGTGPMDIVQLTNPSTNLTASNPTFSNGPSSNDLTNYVSDASSSPGGVHSVIRTNSFGGGPPGTCSPNTVAKSRVVSLLALAQTNSDGSSADTSSGSSSDSNTLKQLLDFSHVIAGLVVVATVLSLIGLGLGVYSCRRGGGTLQNRAVPVSYQPIQLSAPKPYNTPYDNYQDEPVRYDS